VKHDVLLNYFNHNQCPSKVEDFAFRREIILKGDLVIYQLNTDIIQ